MLNFSGDIGDEADELRRERWALFESLFSRYYLRDQVPGLKDEHPFLRLVHSSPLKNAALRLTETFKQWRKRRDEGYGFPSFRGWSGNFFSIEYDERKGWDAKGTDLHLSFGERVIPEAEMSKRQTKALARKRKSDPDAVLKERIGVDLKLTEPAPTDAYRIEVVREGGALFIIFTRKVRMAEAKGAVESFVYLDPNHKNLVYGLSDQGEAFEVANRTGLRLQNISIDQVLSRRDRAVRKKDLVQFTRDDGSVHKHWRPSNAWFRRNRALLREEAKRRDQNKTFVHTTLHRLFDRHDAVGLGNYTPEAKNHRLGRTAKGRKKANRSINNCSLLGKLQLALPKVALKRGRVGYIMDERGTTRTCHACDYVVDGGIKPDIRAWVCPGCGERHIRDENACQNGLGRLSSLLEGDRLLRNPTCDALASGGNQCSDAQARPGVLVASRCDWTFDLNGSCRIVEMPQTTVDKLLASARHVGLGADRVQKKLEGGAAAPNTTQASQATEQSDALVGLHRLC
jgi:putative transposase